MSSSSRDAGQPFVAALAEAVPQVAVRQLHDDHEPAFDDVVAVEREQVRMTDRLHPLECLELLLGVADEVVVLGPQVAEDDFDGFEDAAGGFAAPHFAEPAGTETVQKSVSGNGFRLGFDGDGHRGIRNGCGKRGEVRFWQP